MKKFAFALIAALSVFGATAYATPTQAATITPHITDPSDGTLMVVYFDSRPPSVYIDADSGYYGYLISWRQISDGLYEGTYLEY